MIRPCRGVADAFALRFTEEFAPFAPYRPLGITRVSLGMASTMDDVRAFVAFVKKFFVDSSISPPLRSSVACLDQPSPADHRRRRAKLTEVMLCALFSLRRLRSHGCHQTSC